MLGSEGRKPMLPAELKRMQQAAKKRAHEETDENADPLSDQQRSRVVQRTHTPSQNGSSECFQSPSPRTRRRPVMRPISENARLEAQPEKPTAVIAWPNESLSLRKRVVLTLRTTEPAGASRALHAWSRDLAAIDVRDPTLPPVALLAPDLEYYRYPFPALPSDAPARAARALYRTAATTHAQADDSHLAALATGWRHALLSLYGTWRRRRVSRFYVVQSTLAVVFWRSKDNAASAAVSRAPPALLAALEADGIAPRAIEDAIPDDGQVGGSLEDVFSPLTARPSRSSADNTTALTPDLPDDTAEDECPEDTERSSDIDTIKREIADRATRAGRKQARTRAVAAPLHVLCGEPACHALLDWLHNQRDSRAAAVLPELFSPGPFVGGTLCRVPIAMTGPLAKTGEMQIVLGGDAHSCILPSALESLCSVLRDELAAHGISSVRSQCEDHSRTSVFSNVREI